MCFSLLVEIQLTHEQLCFPAYMWIFFKRYIENFFGDLRQFEKIFSFLFIVRIWYVTPVTYKICIN